MCGFAGAQSNTLNVIPLRTAFGLPEAAITAIAQDSFGYIWIGSTTGLYRFDGQEARRFPPAVDPSAGPPSNLIASLLVDPEGNLWVGGDSWLSHLDMATGKFKSWRHEDYKLWWRVGGMVLADDGLLWLTVTRKGNKVALSSFDPRSETFGGPIYRDNDSVATAWTTRGLGLAMDEYGKLYLATGNGLFSYDPRDDQLIVYHPGGGDSRHFFSVTARGQTIYASEGNAILAFTAFPSRFNSFPHPMTGELIRPLLFDSDSTMLVGVAPFGLWSLNVTTGEFTKVNLLDRNEPADLPIITCLFRDGSGNIWIGTEGGLHLVDADARRFVLKGSLPVHEMADIWSITDIGDRELLFATGDGAWTTDHVLARSKKVTSLSETIDVAYRGKQSVWIVSAGDLYAMSRADGVLRRMPSPSGSVLHKQTTASSIFEDSRGRVWIGGFGNVTCYTPETGRWLYASYEGTASPYPHRNYVTAIEEGPDGVIWICNRLGVDKYDEGTGRFISFDPVAAIPSPEFTDLEFDSQNRMWLSMAYQGILVFDPQLRPIVHLTVVNGFPADEIMEIVKDHWGHMWCRTAGIIAVSPDLKTARHFTISDGLLSNRVDAIAVTGRELLVAYRGGLVQALELPLAGPGHGARLPVFSDIRINGVSHPLNPNLIQALRLPYDRNSISISYSALDFASHPAIRCAYRITPGSGSWHDVGKARIAEFSNLRPGSYDIEIRATDRSGIWGPARVLELTITPPWWQTWAFRSAMALALVVTGFIVVRLYFKTRLRKQRLAHAQQQRILGERVRIASELHDDLGSGLTKISLMSQMASKAGGEKMTGTLERISTESREMVSKMNEIIWALNVTNDTLPGLVAYLRRHAQGMYEESTIRLNLDLPEVVPEVPVSGEVRRNVYMTVKESLHNALRHSGASAITMSISVTDQELRIDIEDNGKGFDGSNGGFSGNGLRNMRKRMTEVGGTFVVDTSGLGTRVCITSPLTVTTKV
jgi:signal transduction histidine kinase/ligand-binding sensor domain-containing protein